MAENNYVDAGMDLTATRFNQREFQLQKKNHFSVQFESDFVDPELRFMLVSFPLPKETTEQSEINYFNQTIKVAGKTTFDNTTMVLRDAISFDTERRFLNWRKRVYDPKTGLMGLAADYKSSAIVTEYTPNKEQLRRWKIIGAWPAGIDYGDLTYDDGGFKDLSVTICYDYAYRDDIDTTK